MTFDPNLVLAIVSVLMFAGLIAFFAFLVRHQAEVEPHEETYGVELLEQHYAPGDTVEQPTPYFVSPIPASPDPLEISANLDKKILVGGLMIFAIMGMIAMYFVIQGNFIPGLPGIRAAAVEHQLKLDIRRGKVLYASLCYDCHGRDGKAGTTPEGKVLPGLPLNTAANKYETLADDPAALETRRRLLENTIERGRDVAPPGPGGSIDMPAWHRAEGGPLSDWQVKQLIDLIMHGTDEDWADIVHVRTTHEPPGPLAEQVPAAPPPPSGEQAAANVCSVCHSFQEDRPSTNPLAPNLFNFGAVGPTVAELRALRDSGDEQWLHKWVSNAPEVKPGTAMPAYGGQLGDAGVDLVVEYLLKLGTEGEDE